MYLGFSFPNSWQTRKKRTAVTPQSSIFKRFSAKFVKFSTKFGSYAIYIICKLETTFLKKSLHPVNETKCQYYVNSMLISCSTCPKEEKECTWVKYLNYAVLSQLQFFCNLRVFSRQISVPKILSSQRKSFFF